MLGPPDFREFSEQVSQIFSWKIWPFYGLLQLYEQKYQITHV